MVYWNFVRQVWFDSVGSVEKSWLSWKEAVFIVFVLKPNFDKLYQIDEEKL